MKTRNAFLFLAALAMAAAPALAQVEHISDDREMFVGTGDTSKILPNIMVLADNSGSMNTAIYHPAYNMRTNYKFDAQGHALDLSESLANLTGTGSIRYLGATTTFNICRGEPHYTITYDVRGYFTGVYRNNPRTWNVNKNSGTFQVGQTIMYNGWDAGNTVTNRANITAITDMGTYWRIRVDTNTPDWGGNPANGTPLYVNYQQVLDYTDSTQAQFNEVSMPCTGFEQQVSNVKLFGTDNGGNDTRYDENFLYWLAFHATEEQINEVTYWAGTGMYPNSEGNLVYFGYYRIQVERDVLTDVINEVYTTVNMGLTVFEDGENPDGGYVKEPMSNMNNAGTLNAMLTSIGNLTATTWTPLSETMADIWYYYKGSTGGSYWPNDGSNSNCGSGSDGSFPTACPIQYTCQKNYIIIMTDGESTQDKWDNADYNGSYFKSTPISTWGDPDDHDNTDLTPNPNGFNPDGTPYCPNNTCWGTNGSDVLDDMAYFLKHNDLFPDALYPDMPGDQSIETFVIGFNMDNDLLRDTAKNGNGEYYTARSYDDLKNALKDAITNILLRNFGFAAFTAPKKVTSTVGEGYSFIGYFLPTASSALWEGHLQSYKMTEKWCRDTSGTSGVLDGTDCDVSYESESKCLTGAPAGVECLRTITLDASSQWDARDEMTLPRKIYTHDSSVTASPYALIEVSTANNATLMPLIGTDATATQTIIDALNSKLLSDIFHSDIAYVGPPMPGKKYLKNLNPPECGTNGVDKEFDAWCFENLLREQGVNPDVAGSGRQKVVYVGSNEGILHCVNALETREKGGGKELWGFIPDEVLPSLKKTFIDDEYVFTVDGRATAEDILYRGASTTWKTLLAFGLKDGGISYYGLDVTSVPASNPAPVVLWKFPLKDTFTEYHGKSWSKPFIGKIRHLEGESWIDRWVVVLAGGMAFNNGRNDDLAGKAVFVIDASNGQLIWQIGYNANGASDSSSTTYIDAVADSTYTGADAHGMRYLTAKPEFNYPIPSGITPVDRNSDGYLDTIYYGNVAGHLFKTDISDINPANWKTYQLYKKDLSAPPFQAAVSGVSGITVTLGTNPGFAVHHNVYGLTSHAMATVDAVSNKTLTLGYMEGSPLFQNGETIVVPSFAPIFLSPAVAYDPCYNLWVNFGSGDRVRSRTNPDSGMFIALRDGSTTVGGVTAQKTDIQLTDLVPLYWTLDGATNTWAMAATNIKVANKWGWYFDFPMAANHEKLFDPEPLVLPDIKMIPHVYFNTYQPPLASASEDCNAPKEGLMYFYDVKMDYCGTGTTSGDMESGRIAGGGVFQGSDYIIYEGTGNVASIPPLQEIKPIKLIYTGGLLFMREKKR